LRDSSGTVFSGLVWAKTKEGRRRKEQSGKIRRIRIGYRTPEDSGAILLSALNFEDDFENTSLLAGEAVPLTATLD
jgi:hypothetical protein